MENIVEFYKIRKAKYKRLCQPVAKEMTFQESQWVIETSNKQVRKVPIFDISFI